MVIQKGQGLLWSPVYDTTLRKAKWSTNYTSDLP